MRWLCRLRVCSTRLWLCVDFNTFHCVVVVVVVCPGFPVTTWGRAIMLPARRTTLHHATRSCRYSKHGKGWNVSWMIRIINYHLYNIQAVNFNCQARRFNLDRQWRLQTGTKRVYDLLWAKPKRWRLFNCCLLIDVTGNYYELLCKDCVHWRFFFLFSFFFQTRRL